MRKRNRSACPVCSRVVTVNADGSLASHGGGEYRSRSGCPGSGTKAPRKTREGSLCLMAEFGCRNAAQARGQCPRCGMAARRLIDEGVETWKSLEAMGLSLPLQVLAAKFSLKAEVEKLVAAPPPAPPPPPATPPAPVSAFASAMRKIVNE